MKLSKHVGISITAMMDELVLDVWGNGKGGNFSFRLLMDERTARCMLEELKEEVEKMGGEG